MKSLRHYFAFCILSLSFAAVGCEFMDPDNYSFVEQCESVSEARECSTCCEAEGFDSGAVFNGDECGCMEMKTDAEVCADSTSSECKSCCNGAGFSISHYSSKDGCECMDIQPPSDS